MAKQTINLGYPPKGDGGDDSRTGFTKANANFDELYSGWERFNALAGAEVGKVVFFATSIVPAGYLECNGAALLRSDFGELFSRLSTVFGAGNGTTTFNLPDLRGEFVRGWDHARGADPGRAFGSWQGDLLKQHYHVLSSSIDAGTGTAGAANGGALRNNANILQYLGNDVPVVYPLYAAWSGGAETRPRNVALMPCIKY